MKTYHDFLALDRRKKVTDDFRKSEQKNKKVREISVLPNAKSFEMMNYSTFSLFKMRRNLVLVGNTAIS